jgi:hypothetical protein
MATDYLKDWTKKVDAKNGGFHLAHKSGNHTISFLPNKEKGGYDVKHSGKQVGHHPSAAGALKIAASYFKQNYNKEAPANVNFSSAPAKKPIIKAEGAPKQDYFKSKLASSEQTPHSKGNKYQSPAEGTSTLDEQRHANIKGVNSPMDSAGSSSKTKSPHVLNEIKSIKPNLPKSELNKAKVDEGKSVVEKVNDRNGRYFRDRLVNLKGAFAKESIQNKNQAKSPDMEFSTPHTKESVKNNAKMTHNKTMSYLKEVKPKLPQ